MSYLFTKFLQFSPIILTAILGLTDSAIGSQVSAPDDQIMDYIEENIQNQKPDSLVTSFSQKLNNNSVLLLTNTLTNVETSTVRTTQKQTVTHPTTIISPPKSIYRQTQESNTSTKVTSIFQTPDLEGRSEARYSVKASDLWLDNSAQVQEKKIEVLTNQTLQLGNLVAQDKEPQTGESEKKPDKSQYNLFNPTPRELWREFSTDRPDKTETPFTVDAGRFTMEADLFIYTRDVNNKEGDDVKTFNYFIPNFKVGLTIAVLNWVQYNSNSG
ncbi:hypothetical protein [Nostoc sp.]|uniref:hypothetical protein n=1 Tax=Nostoc sp. TaxID=1180 RepID=UPI002FFD23F9